MNQCLNLAGEVFQDLVQRDFQASGEIVSAFCDLLTQVKNLLAAHFRQRSNTVEHLADRRVADVLKDLFHDQIPISGQVNLKRIRPLLIALCQSAGIEIRHPANLAKHAPARRSIAFDKGFALLHLVCLTIRCGAQINIDIDIYPEKTLVKFPYVEMVSGAENGFHSKKWRPANIGKRDGLEFVPLDRLASAAETARGC